MSRDARALDRSDWRRGCLVVAIGFACVASALTWLVLLGIEKDSVDSPFACPLTEGSSEFGTATWGWFPPGVTCTWELEGRGTITRSPSPARLAVGALIVAWAGTILLLGTGRSHRSLGPVRERETAPADASSEGPEHQALR